MLLIGHLIYTKVHSYLSSAFIIIEDNATLSKVVRVSLTMMSHVKVNIFFNIHV